MTDTAPASSPFERPVEVSRSSRDRNDVSVALQSWLRRREADAAITSVKGTSATGMSSETILFDAAWGGVVHHLVARVAPDASDVPIFPDYDLQKQFDILRVVRDRSAVPVPDALWYESDRSVLGAPFFVMGRVEGQVPPDNLPYNFGKGWMNDASEQQLRRLQDSTIAVLAHLHTIDDPARSLDFLELPQDGSTHLRRHVADARAWYEFTFRDDGMRSPTVERGFSWLEQHWPGDEGEAVLSWGDSRIGNIMYRDFEPAAVLDWEMVGLGPRELDIGWLIYSHRCYEDHAAKLGLDGLPNLLRRDEVAATYEELTGHRPRDLDFFITYAAIRWGIVGLRTGRRQVHFGEREMPDDIDKLLLNRGPLNRLFDGTYQYPEATP